LFVVYSCLGSFVPVFAQDTAEATTLLANSECPDDPYLTTSAWSSAPSRLVAVSNKVDTESCSYSWPERCESKYKKRIEYFFFEKDSLENANLHLLKWEYLECIQPSMNADMTCKESETAYGKDLTKCCSWDPYKRLRRNGDRWSNEEENRRQMTQCCEAWSQVYTVDRLNTDNTEDEPDELFTSLCCAWELYDDWKKCCDWEIYDDWWKEMCCGAWSIPFKWEDWKYSCVKEDTCTALAQKIGAAYEWMQYVQCHQTTKQEIKDEQAWEIQNRIKALSEDVNKYKCNLVPSLKLQIDEVIAWKKDFWPEVCNSLQWLYTQRECLKAASFMNEFTLAKWDLETYTSQLTTINSNLDETNVTEEALSLAEQYEQIEKMAKKASKAVKKNTGEEPKYRAVNDYCSAVWVWDMPDIAPLAACDEIWTSKPLPTSTNIESYLRDQLEIISTNVSRTTADIVMFGGDSENKVLDDAKESYKTLKSQVVKLQEDFEKDGAPVLMSQNVSICSNLWDIAHAWTLVQAVAEGDDEKSEKDGAVNAAIVTKAENLYGHLTTFCTSLETYRTAQENQEQVAEWETKEPLEDTPENRRIMRDLQIKSCQDCKTYDKYWVCCGESDWLASDNLCYPKDMISTTTREFCHTWTTEDGECIRNDYGSMWLHCTPQQLISWKCSMETYKMLQIRQSNQDPDPGSFIQDIILAITSFVWVVATISLIVIGMRFVGGGVDESQASTAIQWIKYVVIGIMLVALSYTIIRVIQYIAMWR